MIFLSQDTILGSATQFEVFLSFHSYFELIIFPWGHKKEPCPDYLNLLAAGLTMSRVTPCKAESTLAGGLLSALLQKSNTPSG